MPLSDEQVERYSRQLILPEVGPGGQARLGAARVAVVGDGVAAERVVAHLAAAGVGWIAADEALHDAVDPAQPDLTIVPRAAARDVALDAVVVVAERVDRVVAEQVAWRSRAAACFWIAAGRAGAAPPCPACAVDDPRLPRVAPTPVGDALLGTIVATEVVKRLLAIGVPLAGRVLAYEAESAAVTDVPVGSRPSCACGTAAR